MCVCVCVCMCVRDYHVNCVKSQKLEENTVICYLKCGVATKVSLYINCTYLITSETAFLTPKVLANISTACASGVTRCSKCCNI